MSVPRKPTPKPFMRPNTRDVVKALEDATACPACARALVRIRHEQNELRRVARLAARPGDQQRYIGQARSAKEQLTREVRAGEQHLADHERGAA